MNSQRIHAVDITARKLKSNAHLSLKDQQLRNNMRSAIGMAYFGRRWGDDRLIESAERIKNLALAAPGSGAQEGGCEQPYKPMWMEYFGAGGLDQCGIESWPPHPHEKPFAAMTVDQPGGPQIIGGMPPHTVGGGLLRVEREGGNENYEAQVLSSPGASLVEFEGRRYLVLQSTVTSASVRALFSFWDFDDPCRQLPVKSDDASSTTTTGFFLSSFTSLRAFWNCRFASPR